MKPTTPILVLAALGAIAAPAWATDHTGVWTDPAGDARIQRTDPGNDAPLPAGFTPIDLLEVSVQGWSPVAPTDRYTGAVLSPDADADIVRVRVTLAGLVAPPGPAGFNGFDYDPHRYGDRPLFGFIELDIDDQKNSGGELMPLARNRYLANVGRFGLSPEGSFSARMVRWAQDLDNDFATGPQFERTGGEFTLALCGCWAPVVVSEGGDQDGRFDAGETWIVRARFFERFQSFADASALFGGSDPGLFDPMVDLQFRHDTASDTTTVTLVFPVTNAGAAWLAGGTEQPLDYSLINHTSIEEALADLIEGVPFAAGPLATMVDPWDGRDWDDYRRPSDWGVTALIGTMPLNKEPAGLFVWTDTGFDERFGDLNDDDLANAADRAIVTSAIATLDGTSADADGMVNGSVGVVGFGPAFDLRDLDGNGVIDAGDAGLLGCPADLAEPFGTVNFFDLARFVTLFQQRDPAADANADGLFNFFDFSVYLGWFNTPCP